MSYVLKACQIANKHPYTAVLSFYVISTLAACELIGYIATGHVNPIKITSEMDRISAERDTHDITDLMELDN